MRDIIVINNKTLNIKRYGGVRNLKNIIPKNPYKIKTPSKLISENPNNIRVKKTINTEILTFRCIKNKRLINPENI
jgi:hypothetical protein